MRRCTAFLYCGLAALSYVISCLHGSTGHIILCGIIRVFAYMHICRGGKQLHGERESGMTGQGWGFCGCVCGSCKGLGLGCPVRGLYFGVWQWGGKTAKQSVGQCNCSPRVKYARYCGVLTGQGGEPPRILSRNILTKAPFFSYSGRCSETNPIPRLRLGNCAASLGVLSFCAFLFHTGRGVGYSCSSSTARTSEA